MAMKFRKRPVEVMALQWEGSDTKPLDDFLGLHWTRADARDVPWDHEDDEQVVIYSVVEKTWIPCPVGWWIIRGVAGEFYPCEPTIFLKTYDHVEEPIF
jgi:hypothetical protein